MGMFTVIPKDTFDAMQLDAGVLLTTFNPAAPAKPADETIICATTGGINAVCQPEYSDLGEDVDNVPLNMKELKHLDGWTCTLGFTSLDTSTEGIRLALGAADINAESGSVIPRRDLSQDDFSDVWWVGDKANGGFVAVRLMNALSTEGFSLQTTKNGKGQTDCTLTGHVSINDQDTMPMVFYSYDPEDPPAPTYREVTPIGTENPSEEGWYERRGESEPYAYVLTTDTEVDTTKTYYEVVA